jgi:hypothetical protein
VVEKGGAKSHIGCRRFGQRTPDHETKGMAGPAAHLHGSGLES